jgi:hypothetical protein
MNLQEKVLIIRFNIHQYEDISGCIIEKSSMKNEFEVIKRFR